MSGFNALHSYSPLNTLTLGLLFFTGMIGVGLLIVDKAKLPLPWRIVLAALLGIQIFSIGIQGIAISQIATPFLLILYTFFFSLVGFITFLFRIRNNSLKFNRTCFQFHWFWVIYLGMILTLLMAMHGSTKIDELHYHMLVPARIVSDGGLHFYQTPWQGAILPQMTYQIAMAPFHALGFVHLGNIISWLFSILMIWAVALLVWDTSKSAGWTALIVSSFSIGMYPMVWYVASGAHALGDISVIFSLIALVQFESFRDRIGTSSTILMISFLALSAATTKLSVIPFSVLVLLFLINKTIRMKIRFSFLILVPWLLFYTPICIWTWIESGSPFGSALTKIFGSHVYNPIEIQKIIENTKGLDRINWSSELKIALFSHSPLVWVFTIGLFISKGTPKFIPIIFFSLQCLLIATMILPIDLRFLSGTQLSAMVIFGIYGHSKMSWLTKSPSMMRTALLLGTLPWLSIQCLYATPFVKRILGITSITEFNTRYIAFYEDYAILDSILPKNATLLVKGIRLNSIYAPRDVFFTEADLPSNRPSFLFQVVSNNELKKTTPIIYENKSSTIQIYRTPGESNKLGRLIVSAYK